MQSTSSLFLTGHCFWILPGYCSSMPHFNLDIRKNNLQQKIAWESPFAMPLKTCKIVLLISGLFTSSPGPVSHRWSPYTITCTSTSPLLAAGHSSLSLASSACRWPLYIAGTSISLLIDLHHRWPL
ncbi:hypothetical protein KEM48_008976 [Puccinia striiformis f. sp. tritici PST-130]|nr:hypothetical protein KEM48_008976 [Puccinia striiformis f. sp. tritici PST-130]